MTEVLDTVEGGPDAPVAEKLMLHVGRRPRQVSAAGGAATIDVKFKRWALPTNRAPMLVVRDWDLVDGVLCPSALVD